MIWLQVILGLTVFWVSNASHELEPRERCVPTAAAYGPCHVCLCSVDGVYYCRSHACKNTNIRVKDLLKDGERECERNRLYREDAIFCSCSPDSFWMTTSCRKKFQIMRPNAISPMQTIRTNIPCTPNEVYLLDCNICVCGANGVIELSTCTNRRCNGGHKVDACRYGDVLRVPEEICTCSDINLYIDRLCLKVKDTAIQRINKSDLIPLIDIGKSWTRTNEMYASACQPGSLLVFDCNTCHCDEGKNWGCTLIQCLAPNFDDMLRSKKQETEFNSLQVLKSEKGPCTPGVMYRYKCNSCICSKKGLPMCTTMLCMEDVVLDKRIVEKSYRETRLRSE